MSRSWVILKRTGRLLKFLLLCVVLSICIFLLWRVFSTGIPNDLKTFIPNDSLSIAYDKQGQDLYMFRQNLDIITRAEHNKGYFAVPESVFIPDANQAQIVFRYNNSTITSVASDYSLDSVPSRDKELFDVTLVLYVDLTPDIKEDNYSTTDENVRAIRVKPSAKKSAQSQLYNFYRYLFDFSNAEEDINLSELLESGTLIAVHAQVYYKDDLDYSKAPYGAICLYASTSTNKEVKWSAANKKYFEED